MDGSLHQIWLSELPCGPNHSLQLVWQSAEVFEISWDSVRVEFCYFPISGLSPLTHLLVLLCSLWYMCLLFRRLLSVVLHVVHSVTSISLGRTVNSKI